MPDDAVYVYAIGDAGLAAALPGIAGVSGAPLRAVGSGALVAVVSSVDTAEFGDEALPRNLEDLGWLADTARAHHTVVDALARRHSVAPVRLATVYLDDANLRTMLDQRAAAFGAVLDRIRGRTEWGVKAFVIPPSADRHAAEQQPSVPSGTGAGRAYLMQRRAARDRAAEARRSAVDAAGQLHEELSRLTVASRHYPPQDPQLTGCRDEMVLNAAYLVDHAGEAAVRGRVERQGAPGLRLELTGPWAPYSFATVEQV
ncbi:GvpL/GvpF family gas vesicle protein [Pseudonocardia hispaniensis]|uniref:GvpL/GvpF family gas vesicle protein n=1 Tax=Pseudonocardia hispaniensis TaxID=904933 RepID=A0ABW1IY84_9PSEU